MDQSFCNKCGRRYRGDPKNPTATLCDRCGKEAEKLQKAVGNMTESHYKLVDAHQTNRSAGRYVNRLRSILNIGLGVLPESKWRAEVGDDKFEEALEYGLLVVEEFPSAPEQAAPEEIEREGNVIKEQPSTMNVDRVVSFSAEGNKAVFVAEVTSNGQSGMVRMVRDGSRSEWTTDNLDLLSDEMCKDLANLGEAVWKNAPKEVSGADSGPLPYAVRSVCQE